ncbi:hypothetical protein B0T17DRAFT_518792 [Bombardia bombarda]|uniref:Uncharacterized protein n=1 Tax=Bombardia bombarda TaxID=252184 RepID=A0AA40CG63_9PEZI|nr:hypothetical protein B0T17DRAFT_518792 [Bombardia bombarda]
MNFKRDYVASELSQIHVLGDQQSFVRQKYGLSVDDHISTCPRDFKAQASGARRPDHRVQDKGKKKFRTRSFPLALAEGFPLLKWNRRVIFSPQTGNELGGLTRRWLAVAHIWSHSREWLQDVDILDLVSLETSFCVRVHEKITRLFHPDLKEGFVSLYHSDKIPDDSRPQVTSNNHAFATILSDGRRVFILPGAPIPKLVSEISELMGSDPGVANCRQLRT